MSQAAVKFHLLDHCKASDSYAFVTNADVSPSGSNLLLMCAVLIEIYESLALTLISTKTKKGYAGSAEICKLCFPGNHFKICFSWFFNWSNVLVRLDCSFFQHWLASSLAHCQYQELSDGTRRRWDPRVYPDQGVVQYLLGLWMLCISLSMSSWATSLGRFASMRCWDPCGPLPDAHWKSI